MCEAKGELVLVKFILIIKQERPASHQCMNNRQATCSGGNQKDIQHHHNFSKSLKLLYFEFIANTETPHITFAADRYDTSI